MSEKEQLKQVNISMTIKDHDRLFEMMTEDGTYNRSQFIRILLDREWASRQSQKKASSK